jgi:transcriptional antiterminator NusG
VKENEYIDETRPGEADAASRPDEPEQERSARSPSPEPGSASPAPAAGARNVDAGADAGPESDEADELEIAGEDESDEDLDEDEDAAPLEDLVEEEPADEDIRMDWYILKVQVNRENSICDALRRRVKVAGLDRFFGEILVPTEDVREFTKSGKQRIVKRKLYPGYIVVNMSINDDSWFLVRETPGIGDFTGAAGKPAPLSSDEIERIVASTRPETVADSEEATVKTAIKFKPGDRVRVKEGYFQNYEGDVSSIDERNGRVTVMINIFGRPNPVTLDHWQVEDL